MSEQVPTKDLVCKFKRGDIVRWNALALHGIERDGWAVQGLEAKDSLLPIYRLRRGKQTGSAVETDLEALPDSQVCPEHVTDWAVGCPSCGWAQDAKRTSEQRPSKDVSGPPFTVDRYGSFAEAVIAHRDWLSREIEELRRDNVRWENAHKILIAENERLKRANADLLRRNLVLSTSPEPRDVSAEFTRLRERESKVSGIYERAIVLRMDLEDLLQRATQPPGDDPMRPTMFGGAPAAVVDAVADALALKVDADIMGLSKPPGDG